MLNSCPTTEAIEYLTVEWKKYEMKCRDIEVGTTILMELDPIVFENIIAGFEEQSKEYSKLSNNMGRILTNLTKIQHDNPKFQRDFIVYYKESYMDRASPQGQKHFLLKCLDAELRERMLAITDAQTPIFDI